MGAISDFLETAYINHTFRGIGYTAPTTLAVALCTASPGETGTGSAMSEVTGGAYSRVSVAPGTANWAAVSAGNGTTNNLNTITFPTATASWGTINYVAICDALSGGNMLFYGSLSSPAVVSSGDTFTFSAGSLAVTIDT